MHPRVRAVRRCFRWGGAETKVGAKPLDKAAQGVGLGGDISSFALPEAKIFYFMFS